MPHQQPQQQQFQQFDQQYGYNGQFQQIGFGGSNNANVHDVVWFAMFFYVCAVLIYCTYILFSDIFQPDLDTVTHGRLLMEKNFYLNQSNSKYITIGIKPASKLHNNTNMGFYVDVNIGGKTMKPMSLGGIDGFLNLCQSLRSFDELKFTYPQFASSYEEIESQFPLNISKKPYNGMVCFHIETLNGGYAAIAQNSCTELLKFESLIVASIKKMQSIVGEIEGKFNEFVQKCSVDYGGTIKAIEKSMDTLAADIFTNFNELLRICIDQLSLINTTATASAAAAPKRKRTPKAKLCKKAKLDDDHNYAGIDGESDEVELIEVTETQSDEHVSDKQTDPLGLIESGQRMESEILV